MARARRAKLYWLEALESRCLLAGVGVDAGKIIRSVDPKILGTNLAWWNGDLGNAQTRQLAAGAGLNMYRFPGGSSSDEWHFTNPAPYGRYKTLPSFARVIQAENAGGMAQLDYGSGSAHEAAAF